MIVNCLVYLICVLFGVYWVNCDSIGYCNCNDCVESDVNCSIFFEQLNNLPDGTNNGQYGYKLSPFSEEGNHFLIGVDEQDQARLERSDIRDGQAGINLHLIVRLINSLTCEPMVGVYVYIWHANALGIYSGMDNGQQFKVKRSINGANFMYGGGDRGADGLDFGQNSRVEGGFYDNRGGPFGMFNQQDRGAGGGPEVGSNGGPGGGRGGGSNSGPDGGPGGGPGRESNGSPDGGPGGGPGGGSNGGPDGGPGGGPGNSNGPGPGPGDGRNQWGDYGPPDQGKNGFFNQPEPNPMKDQQQQRPPNNRGTIKDEPIVTIDNEPDTLNNHEPNDDLNLNETSTTNQENPTTTNKSTEVETISTISPVTVTNEDEFTTITESGETIKSSTETKLKTTTYPYQSNSDSSQQWTQSITPTESTESISIDPSNTPTVTQSTHPTTESTKMADRSDFEKFPGQKSIKDDRFLRGYQMTNRHGDASFITIIPGWYGDRNQHVHLEVYLDKWPPLNVTYVGQLYLPIDDQSLINRLQSTQPYNQIAFKLNHHENDLIFQQSKGNQSILSLEPIGNGYQAIVTIGIDPMVTN